MPRQLKDVNPFDSPLAFFAGRLRQHRLRLGLTQAQLGKRTNYSEDTISKVETGEATPSVDLGRACDEVFGTHGDMEALAEMVHRTAAFPSWIKQLVDAEQKAHTLRSWELAVAPALLQTAEYARALLRAEPGATEERIEESVEARMQRQGILDRDNSPLLLFVLDEGALHRPVGSGEVMRTQLQALLDASRKPNVTIQVVPLAAGVHPGVNGKFVIASFNGGPDVVYLESARAGQITDRPEDVAAIVNTYDHAIRAKALPIDASQDLVTKVMEQWT